MARTARTLVKQHTLVATTYEAAVLAATIAPYGANAIALDTDGVIAAVVYKTTCGWQIERSADCPWAIRGLVMQFTASHMLMKDAIRRLRQIQRLAVADPNEDLHEYEEDETTTYKVLCNKCNQYA